MELVIEKCKLCKRKNPFPLLWKKEGLELICIKCLRKEEIELNKGNITIDNVRRYKNGRKTITRVIQRIE